MKRLNQTCFLVKYLHSRSIKLMIAGEMLEFWLFCCTNEFIIEIGLLF